MPDHTHPPPEPDPDQPPPERYDPDAGREKATGELWVYTPEAKVAPAPAARVNRRTPAPAPARDAAGRLEPHKAMLRPVPCRFEVKNGRGESLVVSECAAGESYHTRRCELFVYCTRLPRNQARACSHCDRYELPMAGDGPPAGG
ncbi:MAG: hypothetical protein K2V38_08245 [Gemmataceae bacterium]|nr:hypothetical protein [Gemmataceae bacterium]